MWRISLSLFLSMFIAVLSTDSHGQSVPERVANTLAQLSVLDRSITTPPPSDYLIDPSFAIAKAYRDEKSRSLILDNGLVRRTFRIAPNGACVAFDNLMTGQAILRSVRPEALVTIDGQEYEIGGLSDPPNHAYLTEEWLKELQSKPDAFQLSNIVIGKPVERLAWKRVRHHAPNVNWPPPGVHLRMDYVLPNDAKNATLSVHYELYDHVPVISKWMTVQNSGDTKITVDRFTAEQLALVEYANWVEKRDDVDVPRSDMLHVETDFAFGGFCHENGNRHVVHYRPDPKYSTQVNYLRATPCLLEVQPTYGPAQVVEPNATFSTFRTFELAFSGSDRERRSIELKRMYRTIAPWVTENPITHHLINSKPDTVREAIAKAKEVGFEAVIMSFGSRFEMENDDPAYLQQWKEVADFAAEQGVELGSYSLFSSRSVGNGNDIVPPEGKKLTHGRCPSATSEWGRNYYKTLKAFYDTTGFDQFENDGPYPGDVDVTPRPPFQKGIQDSRWAQWEIVTGLYKHLRSTGVYINAPDYYYLSGSNKCGMGYREVNWSLPREQQIIHTRQNIYDGTWAKTPSMGWMFVPLSNYHGGGAAARIEPLNDHLDHYDRLMKSNLGMGVQAHYRGPRLFDTVATRDMIRRNVVWFKKYRDILESDFVHGRRADGRELDWVLHVNPQLAEKGMLCVYNPLDEPVTRKLSIDVYLTGLTDTAELSHEGEDSVKLPISRDYKVAIDATVPANDMTWFVLR